MCIKCEAYIWVDGGYVKFKSIEEEEVGGVDEEAGLPKLKNGNLVRYTPLAKD